MLGPALVKMLGGAGAVEAATKMGIAGFGDEEAGLGNALRSRLGIGGRRVDSEAQLRAAQQRDAMVTPEMDKIARSRGFNSYAEMRAYETQRQRKTGGTVPGQPSGDQASNPLSWTPRALFDYVSRKYNEAVSD